jgi:hypothetical protein
MIIGWALVAVAFIVIVWAFAGLFGWGRKVPLSPENLEALREYQRTRAAMGRMFHVKPEPPLEIVDGEVVDELPPLPPPLPRSGLGKMGESGSARRENRGGGGGR